MPATLNMSKMTDDERS